MLGAFQFSKFELYYDDGSIEDVLLARHEQQLHR